MFGFPPFCFHYVFLKLFLFQSKLKNVVKDKNQNFTSNELDEKESEHPFLKKLISEYLTLSLISFEIFVGSYRSRR